MSTLLTFFSDQEIQASVKMMGIVKTILNIQPQKLQLCQGIESKLASMKYWVPARKSHVLTETSNRFDSLEAEFQFLLYISISKHACWAFKSKLDHA